MPVSLSHRVPQTGLIGTTLLCLQTLSLWSFLPAPPLNPKGPFQKLLPHSPSLVLHTALAASGAPAPQPRRGPGTGTLGAQGRCLWGPLVSSPGLFSSEHEETEGPPVWRPKFRVPVRLIKKNKGLASKLGPWCRRRVTNSCWDMGLHWCVWPIACLSGRPRLCQDSERLAVKPRALPRCLFGPGGSGSGFAASRPCVPSWKLEQAARGRCREGRRRVPAPLRPCPAPCLSIVLLCLPLSPPSRLSLPLTPLHLSPAALTSLKGAQRRRLGSSRLL